MGLFKKLVSDAVGEGIGKGIQNEVGKAVESAVRPAADKLAGQAANQLNQASQDMAANAAEAQDAAARAAADTASVNASYAAAPAAPGAGAASLGAALSGWAASVQNMAGQVAQTMKECPNCGEYSTADHKFCPKCGAKLPEQTVGAGYLCPNCGKQNVPGTTFCAECGTRLPAAEQAAAAQAAKWEALLPQYPKWNLGGIASLEESGSVNGAPAVRLRIEGAGRMQLAQYVEQLKAAGFVPYGGVDSDVYYKTVGGVCRAFDKTDALSNGSLDLSFYVGDYDRRAAVKDKTDATLGAAKDTAKAAADAAKGLFKKFF